MTSNEFILWLKGFTEGVHEFNITPKQWDILKDKLAQVEDKILILESPKFPFGTPNTTPNTHPFPTWQHPHYTNPIGVVYNPPYDLYNPFKVTCSSGSFGTITTTPGTGHITIANPNLVSWGSGSYYNPTSTTYGYPSGSAWSYTNNTYKPPYTTGGEDEIIKHHNED